MQCISLVNRLIFVPSLNTTTVLEKKYQSSNQTLLYSLLIRSINDQNYQLANIDEVSSTNETITKNNQFLLQLNLMMSNSNANKSSSTLSSKPYEYNCNKNETNWFHLLTKIAIYKSNSILDCLLFSIFKKISQLTPRLFGSLLGVYSNHMHRIILKKLDSKNDGQVISIVSEFLCSLIENQPGYFNILSSLKVESVNQTENLPRVKRVFLRASLVY